MPVRIDFLPLQGRREPLVAPVQPQDQSVLIGEEAWKFQGFSTPSPPLAPSPQPAPPIARGQKNTLLQCLYCITGEVGQTVPSWGR